MIREGVFSELETSVEIYCDKRLVGTLFSSNNALGFTYAPEWLQDGDPLSPFLPFSGQYRSDDIHNYFDAFMPEGKRRELLSRQDKLPGSDLVGFLRRHGEDLPGSLHAEPAGKSSDNEDVTKQIAQLISTGLSLGNAPQHSLLSGVDDKLAVIATQNGGSWNFCVSSIDRPSTHIIKKGNDLCLNEAFCLDLARRCGLPVMPSDLVAYNGVEALITKRFDRAKNAAGQIIRLEQKDLCQLAGKRPDEKYCHQGFGLSTQDIAAILAQLPKSETWKFLAASMFSLIIGNSDDHGKNYALLYAPGANGPVLAPLYDIASISAYLLYFPHARGTTRLARPIGNARYDLDLTPEDIRSHISLFAVNYNEFTDMFQKLVSAVRETAPAVHAAMGKRLAALALDARLPENDFMLEHMLGRCAEFYTDFANRLRACKD